MVEFKVSVKNYYPGSVEVPTWVKNDYYHRVTQTLYKEKNTSKESVRLPSLMAHLYYSMK